MRDTAVIGTPAPTVIRTQVEYAITAGGAFLLYVRYAGDTGFTSRDPAYDGPEDAVLDFRLSNGQSDVYPTCWTIPLADALRALEYALMHRARAPWVTWHDASVSGG